MGRKRGHLISVILSLTFHKKVEYQLPNLMFSELYPSSQGSTMGVRFKTGSACSALRVFSVGEKHWIRKARMIEFSGGLPSY